ncbi:MAG TPA: hypothetical protein VKT78_13780, partial [Fimbriimonadaceae bacterium]|nr:hypothetical protein [Fimbriimonadaceae bacterium]
MNRFYYSRSLRGFLADSPSTILGELANASTFDTLRTQSDAWATQIQILQDALRDRDGQIVFEFSVPRMGSRIDVVLIIANVVFVIEFKVGAETHDASAIDQVYDYALDLHYFHEPSHDCALAPILFATGAPTTSQPAPKRAGRSLIPPVKAGAGELGRVLDELLSDCDKPNIDPEAWIAGRYNPTPTIVEAARALYR